MAYAASVNSRLFATNTADLHVPGVDSVEALGRFNFEMASPDYFRVMQTRILRGRPITETDRAGGPLVTVVSEAMGRALWPGRDPLGQCIHVSIGDRGAETTARPCTTVVGVAENTVQQNVGDDPGFMYYLAAEQFAPSPSWALWLRMSSIDAKGQIEAVRRALTRAMPGDGFAVVQPLQDAVDGHTRSWRLGATLFVSFGGLALVVVLVGLYGVVSYQVAQRMHELGVRVALGARSSQVVWLVVSQGVRVTLVAVGVGFALALAAARWVQPLLFRQSAIDPITYSIVGGAMLLAAIAASAVPAARAMRADPSAAMRVE